ncbi:glycosyltransferase family 2 protein [Heyndrickxia coagulans]|uniref:glycosyltransferase family 2 protein n=1 Tax=Heyndrickxia coagulans TaxID=1398 RepID=UPI002E1B5E51|nr:glycosyltransferase family 2 protein [Heyndrickxia coagulans]
MKISVITPCYNSVNTIERTIKSVVEQDYSDIEYIIIDGNSNDGTLDIIKSYSGKYRFIKYISEHDKSMTEALNKGLKLASGQIVCSLNADDEYLPGTINFVMDKFSKNDIEILVGNTRVIHDKSEKLIYTATPRSMGNYFLMCALDCLTPECSVFFRRTCFEKIGYFNEKIKYTQDYELYLRLIKNGFKFSYFNQDLSNFFISDEQYSISAADKMRKEVSSYIEFKYLHFLFRRMRINGLIRTMLKQRRYKNFSSFIEHVIRK